MQLALDIQHESRLNSQLISSMEETFEKARAQLRRTAKRVDRAFKFTGSGHIFILLVFAILVFVAFYVFLKVYAWGKFVGKVTGILSG